jgi:hypothetical protein
MSEVGRQDGHALLGVLSGLVPANEGSRRENVSLIPTSE